MKGSFTGDLKQVLELEQKMGNDINSDCDESTEIIFRAMFDGDSSREKTYDILQRTVDIDARTYLHGQIIDAIKRTMDRYKVGIDT